MLILDRERYWSFVKAYLICFAALVGLYVVIDAFTNLDDFLKSATTPLGMFQKMGRFYLIRLVLFYDKLCGVITMMAAIFTVTWLQRNNELLAMLAAGISTQRVIRPVWISAIFVSLLALANSEVMMPRFGAELQKQPGEDDTRRVMVFQRYDVNSFLIHGGQADRPHATVMPFNATLFVNGEVRELEARQARYIPRTATRLPYRGGWLIHEAKVNPPLTEPELKALGRVLIPVGPKDLKRYPPPIALEEKKTGPGREPGATIVLPPGATAATKADPSPVADEKPAGAGGSSKAAHDPAKKEGPRAFFLRTNVTFATITQSPIWYQFGTTPALIRSLSDPSFEASRDEIAVALHTRILRPLSSLTLLFLSLPLVLGGANRNMFINLGMSLGTSAVFYGVTFLTQYLGGNGLFSPELAAWIPLMVFGTLAVARWDRIRT